MNKRQKLGKKGEDLAVQFLVNKGYEVLDRNWRHGRIELDIVAKIGGKLIFLEVKTKKSDVVKPPEASVGPRKRRHIIDAANRYMEAIEYDHEIRFDIVAILVHSEVAHTIKHIEDAFFPGMR